LTYPAAVRAAGVAPVAAGLALSLGLGAAIARGGLMSISLMALVVGICLALHFSQLRLTALVGWIVISPLAYPFLRYPSEHALLTFDRVWVGALTAVLLLGRRRQRPSAARSRLFSLALLALVAASGARAATSVRPLPAVDVWLDAIVLPAVLFAVARETVKGKEDARRLVGALTTCGFVLAGIGLVGRAAGLDLASLTGGGLRIDELGLLRISGPYPAPEPFALALLVCLAATIWWTATHGGGARILGCVVAYTELAAIGLTLFRAAWIAAALVVAASLGLRPRRPGRVVAICVALGVLLLGGAGALRHNATLAARIDNTANIDGRLATYLTGVHIFEQSPVFGVGVNGFADAERIHGERVNGVLAIDSPHSSYVAMLAEQGILGFLPLLGATVAGALLVRRYRQVAWSREDVLLSAAAVGAGLAYMTMSLSLTMLTYGPSNALFATFLGLVAARLDALEGDGD
jgi:hypothetical protein